VVALDDCGHSPFVDQPQRVIAEVGEFLSSLGIGARETPAAAFENHNPR
jgi:hypothetical protein